MLSAQNVDVQVVDGLTSMLAIVDHYSVAVLLQAFFLCHLRRHPHQMAHLLLMLRSFDVLEHGQVVSELWDD